MTTPGTNINCRCYLHCPLFIKLTTDYPGDWTQHKTRLPRQVGKVTAYVYQTGSDRRDCVRWSVSKKCERANSLTYLDDALESCVETIKYCLKLWYDDLVVSTVCVQVVPDQDPRVLRLDRQQTDRRHTTINRRP